VRISTLLLLNQARGDRAPRTPHSMIRLGNFGHSTYFLCSEDFEADYNMQDPESVRARSRPAWHCLAIRAERAVRARSQLHLSKHLLVQSEEHIARQERAQLRLKGSPCWNVPHRQLSAPFAPAPQVARLHATLRPHLLRRVIKDVEKVGSGCF